MQSWRAMVQSMSEDDAQTFAVAFGTAMIVGMSAVGGILYCLDKKYKIDEQEPQPRQQLKHSIEKEKTKSLGGAAATSETEKTSEARGTNKKAAAAAASKPTSKATGAKNGSAMNNMADKIDYVPLAASQTMIDRGNRLLEENKPRDALVCFLSLLYSAHSGEHGSLPAHLTDCLRGAAQCFRALGDGEEAVKFLQAERRVYEEMVASMLKGKTTQQAKGNAGNILANLLDPTAKDTPHRCNVLSDVAELCSKNGYDDIALAYRVKVAALKQKVSGKAMDPESKEFNDLAKSLQKMASYSKGEGGEEAPPAAIADPPAATA